MSQLLGCDKCGLEIPRDTSYISFPVYRMNPVDNSSNLPAGAFPSSGSGADRSQPIQIDTRDYHEACWELLNAEQTPEPRVTPNVPEVNPESGVPDEELTEESGNQVVEET